MCFYGRGKNLFPRQQRFDEFFDRRDIAVFVHRVGTETISGVTRKHQIVVDAFTVRDGFQRFADTK